MPNPADPQRNRNEGGRRSLRESMNAGNGAAPFRNLRPTPPPADSWDNDAPAREEEIEQTSAEENEDILASLRKDRPEEGADPAEYEKIQGENEQLRQIIDELRHQLEQEVSKGQEGWSEREHEFESLLEEKSERIRELHMRTKELEEAGSGAASGTDEDGAETERKPGGDSEEELLALSDELERERCQLEQERRTMDDDRKQLREDEESMMRQMRDMELQMAKERAELARQRNELQRLHSEIRHELELTQRDAAVNERLKLLQRRSQLEVPAAGDTQVGRKNTTPNASAPKPKQSLFGRFLGGGK